MSHHLSAPAPGKMIFLACLRTAPSVFLTMIRPVSSQMKSNTWIHRPRPFFSRGIDSGGSLFERLRQEKGLYRYLNKHFACNSSRERFRRDIRPQRASARAEASALRLTSSHHHVLSHQAAHVVKWISRDVGVRLTAHSSACRDEYGLPVILDIITFMAMHVHPALEKGVRQPSLMSQRRAVLAGTCRCIARRRETARYFV